MGPGKPGKLGKLTTFGCSLDKSAIVIDFVFDY